jgi:FMN phosphatase YigB (HAD superfamily)
MLKALIFDMDDTLIDWESQEEDWFERDRVHLRNVFDYVNEKVHIIPDFEAFAEIAQHQTKETWLKSGRSLSAPHIGNVIRKTLTILGAPESKIDVDACLRAYNWTGLPGVQAFDDVIELLPSIHAQGIKLGIVTNAYYPMWMRDKELTLLGIDPKMFDSRISSADIGYLKPHRAIFRQSLANLDAKPDEAVFIGDNLKADIGGAKSLGMKAVLRASAGTQVKEQDQNAPVPDATISSLHDLLPVLDKWYPGWRNRKKA